MTNAAITTSVAASTTSVSLLAAEKHRDAALIFNDSTSILYVKFGIDASPTSYTVKMAANDYFEFPQPAYVGPVSGVWVSVNGAARITEIYK